jgi:Resolvase, N terminal domain
MPASAPTGRLTLDAQLEQLGGAGCTKVYREKVTGAHSHRHELLKLLKSLAAGDTVTVTRIDRLARSTFDLFGIHYGPAERGYPTPRGERYARRARPEIQRPHIHRRATRAAWAAPPRQSPRSIRLTVARLTRRCRRFLAVFRPVSCGWPRSRPPDSRQ